MTGYLQRLVDMRPGVPASMPEPVVRSESPIAENDQRLALDPMINAPGEIPMDDPAGPQALSRSPVASAGQHAAVRPTAAMAPLPAMPPPFTVQRFQAPSTQAAAPSAAAVAVAPGIAPATHAAPQPIQQTIVTPPAATPSPVTIINKLAEAVWQPAQTSIDSRPQSPPGSVPEPSRAKAAPPPPESAKTAGQAPTAPIATRELAYTSPAEQMFEALQQRSPLRPLPVRDSAEAMLPPAAPPPPPETRPQQTIPSREIRETIREIVREVVSAPPAPPRDTQRQPKTAAEASVIGPLGNPHAATRRLALLLR